jgi:hypothetical protein
MFAMRRDRSNSKIPTLDAAVLAAIIVLAERRSEGKNITYGALGALIGRHHRTLTPILNRVGAWCYSIGKESLAILVVSKSDGLPGWGFFEHGPGELNPITRKSYHARRRKLCAEDWSQVKIPPSAREVAQAFARYGMR